MEICQHFLTWWSKLFSLCPEDIFEEIHFFFTKSSKFSFVFRLWGSISDFCGNYSCWFVKTVFKCPGAISERVVFWKQLLWIVSLFLDFGSNLFGLSTKIFRQLCQNCILCVQWRFLIGLFFLQKFMSFRTVFGVWRKFSGILAAQKLQKDCQNWDLCV